MVGTIRNLQEAVSGAHTAFDELMKRLEPVSAPTVFLSQIQPEPKPPNSSGGPSLVLVIENECTKVIQLISRINDATGGLEI